MWCDVMAWQYLRTDEVGRVISVEEHEQDDDEKGDSEYGELDDEKSAMASRAAAADDSVQGCFTHEDSVYCVEVHNNIACSGDGNDTAVVWNTDTGDVMHVLKGQQGNTLHCTTYSRGQEETASQPRSLLTLLVHSITLPAAVG